VRASGLAARPVTAVTLLAGRRSRMGLPGLIHLAVFDRFPRPWRSPSFAVRFRIGRPLLVGADSLGRTRLEGSNLARLCCSAHPRRVYRARQGGCDSPWVCWLWLLRAGARGNRRSLFFRPVGAGPARFTAGTWGLDAGFPRFCFMRGGQVRDTCGRRQAGRGPRPRRVRRRPPRRS